MLSDTILTVSLAATTIAKILVDIIRLGFPTRPKWISPILAILFGIASAFLFSLSSGDTLTQSIVAQNIVAGIIAGGNAVAVTELTNRTNQKE